MILVLNDAGRLGDGTTTDRITPVKIMDDIAFASAGGFHSMAIKNDGTLWAWGDNTYAQLGDMTMESKNTPVQVMGRTAGRVLTVSAGTYHTVITCTKASGILTSYPWADDEIYLFAWGRDENYQVGSGGGVPNPNSGKFLFNTPIQTNIAFGIAGATHTAAVQNNGTLLTWGSNEYGQLGIGLTKDKKNTPVLALENVKLPSPVDTIQTISPASVSAETESIKAVATPTTATVLVNGYAVSFGAYLINDNNYFKMRDLAMVLSSTNKEFDVEWRSDINAIDLITNTSYTTVGGELASGDGKIKNAILSTSSIYNDGQPVQLTAYTIDDNNYFKLRDLAELFNIGLIWNGQTNTIEIDTTKDYVD